MLLLMQPALTTKVVSLSSRMGRKCSAWQGGQHHAAPSQISSAYKSAPAITPTCPWYAPKGPADYPRVHALCIACTHA